MITTLTGTNRFLIDQALKARLSEFIDQHGDLTVEQLDGEETDYQAIYDSLNNLPFLAIKKLTIIRNASANKDFVESAEVLLADLSDTNELILVETKLDKRSSFYKFLKAKTDYHEFNDLVGNELTNWLVEQAKSRGGELSNADTNYLLDLAGSSQLKLVNELTKLINYESKISRRTIDLLVEPIPQTTIFQLIDAVFNAQAERAIKIYDSQREQRIEPQQIIAMLAWQIHILALVKSAASQTPAQVAKQAQLNPFVVNKSWAVARRLSLDKLKTIISELYDLDIKLKTKMIEPDDAIKHFILSIA